MSSNPSNVRPPFTIVLLGGIASGKSTVAGLFAKRGALVLDADRLAHEELATDEVVAIVREKFGDVVLTDGKIDRKKLADVVFKDREKLGHLEAVLHPRVLARIADRLIELGMPKGSPRRVVILDVPLAGETQLARSADLVVYVDASLETRRKRARDRRGWSEGELERREARLLSCEEKRAMADAAVKNDDDVSEAEGDVERIWSSLVGPRLQTA